MPARAPDRRTIPLDDCTVAIVDAADYDRCAEYRWYVHQPPGEQVQAVRHVRNGVAWWTQTLAAFVLGLDYHAPVGFVDGNPLHCWRSNLVVE
ncbi:MAG: hypothetical protein WCC22_02240 [Terriglobales bacterium]